MEAPEPVTVVGAREQVNPMLGETVVASVTTPTKPCRDATVRVEVPAAPAFEVTSDGLAARVKSCTVKVTVDECERDVLVPVMVTA